MVWIFGKWKGGCRGKAHKKEGEGCVCGGGSGVVNKDKETKTSDTEGRP